MVFDLRTVLDGGVGGVAIQVGGVDGDSTFEDEVEEPESSFVLVLIEDEEASFWVWEERLEVGVQMGEAMIDGRGEKPHIFSFLGERATVVEPNGRDEVDKPVVSVRTLGGIKGGFSKVSGARRKIREDVEAQSDVPDMSGEDRGVSMRNEVGMTCIARKAEINSPDADLGGAQLKEEDRGPMYAF